MRLALLALVSLVSLAAPAVGFADTLDTFTVTGKGLQLGFTLPASPVPTGFDRGYDFFLGDISFTEDGTQMTAAEVYFFLQPLGGGFELDDATGTPIDGLSFTGSTLFTGPVRNPTFKTGRFRLQDAACGNDEAASSASNNSCIYRLEIAPVVATTPEPGSLALLATGALGTIGLLRRRLAH